MARLRQVQEFNTFVGGIITEANPLTFPPNAALDINNYALNKTGSISRRLGIDFEVDHVEIDSGVSTGASGEAAINSFSWNNVGGNPALRIVVVQVGKILKFFNTSGSSLSGGLIFTLETNAADNTVRASASVVDGLLIVAVGDAIIYSFDYDETLGVTYTTFKLKIRDIFGVEDLLDGVDLRDPENVNVRPPYTGTESITDEHLYNLRNSTWGPPRLLGDSTNSDKGLLWDTMSIYRGTTGKYPSNADSVTPALFADTAEADDRFSERFFPRYVEDSPIGNFESPRGYFIIDLLNRGESRLEQVAKLEDFYTDITVNLPVTALIQDKTLGGASQVSEFAGRMWYSGFSGGVIGGDRHSPKLSSYVMYSKLVTSPTDLGVCHQVSDPTSKESPDLVDTDGGFIRLDGAYGIKRLINIGSALVVVAENGVWAVLGGSDFGFTALDGKVIKVTEHGCVSEGSILLVDGSVMYWGDDGIYQIAVTETGSLKAVNVTNTTIQSLYEGISSLNKELVQGHYDTYERKVRWLYGNNINNPTDTTELILDLNVSAFYKNTIKGVNSGMPNLVLPVEVPPFKVGLSTDEVFYGSEQVLYGTEVVEDTEPTVINGLREIVYLTVTETFPNIIYTFASYRDTDFIDWKTEDGVGVDSPAYIITGYDGAGDFQRYKQVPYITFHFEKTESGYYTDGLGDIYPLGESSCKVQAQWEWSDSIASGRWGREFQAYRHKRGYIPANAEDGYDNGFKTVISKNKLRGKGKVISLHIKTEPGKDCKILGWSVVKSISNDI
tara:strand:+ start:1522 stop:3870 length:2349 start_codon:yes stop_codon:yes gene_type:complete